MQLLASHSDAYLQYFFIEDYHVLIVLYFLFHPTYHYKNQTVKN